jgi:hypothetical protein
MAVEGGTEITEKMERNGDFEEQRGRSKQRERMFEEEKW